MTGIDIVEVKRIEKAAQSENFLNSVFTEKEISYYNEKSHRAEVLAGMFAAKEAVSKAFKTGFYAGFKPCDIEVLHHENGAPYVNLFKGAEAFFNENFNNHKIDISISHDGGIAAAVVYIYKI